MFQSNESIYNYSEEREPSMVPLASMAVLPKHCHLPDIPSDSNLSFEAMVYVFGIIVMGLQYINLYKTVWWLPHSHANYALVCIFRVTNVHNVFDVTLTDHFQYQSLSVDSDKIKEQMY
jgi:hypothetical protein